MGLMEEIAEMKRKREVYEKTLEICGGCTVCAEAGISNDLINCPFGKGDE